MTTKELMELVHLLLMCGIMDKTVLESGNLTDEEWLQTEGLIDKYQSEKSEFEAEPKPSDLISRDALKKHITEISETEEEIDKKWAMGLKYSLKIIDLAPTVDIENEVSKQLAKEAREIADENFKYGYEKAKKELEERPQSEWIPISKSLPAFTGLYLVSIDDLVTVANFTGAYFINKRGLMLHVSAWQLLPEPYKKDGSEK